MSRAAIEDHVPVIYIGPFRSGSPADKSRVAQEVDDACRGIGFLIVSGHGVPDDLIQRMSSAYREFIALPYWENARLTMSTDRYRGYLPMGSEDAAPTICASALSTGRSTTHTTNIRAAKARGSSYTMYGRTGRKAFAPHGKPITPRWNVWAEIS